MGVKIDISPLIEFLEVHELISINYSFKRQMRGKKRVWIDRKNRKKGWRERERGRGNLACRNQGEKKVILATIRDTQTESDLSCLLIKCVAMQRAVCQYVYVCVYVQIEG